MNSWRNFLKNSWKNFLNIDNKFSKELVNGFLEISGGICRKKFWWKSSQCLRKFTEDFLKQSCNIFFKCPFVIFLEEYLTEFPKEYLELFLWDISKECVNEFGHRNTNIISDFLHTYKKKTKIPTATKKFFICKNLD